ncbi:MAG: hypothetical protein WAU77_10190 [Solirubrobacteraceae bacterium]
MDRPCAVVTRARATPAGLRPLRFHDLRHTFGSVAIRTADPRELQEWMVGLLDHADLHELPAAG